MGTLRSETENREGPTMNANQEYRVEYQTFGNPACSPDFPNPLTVPAGEFPAPHLEQAMRDRGYSEAIVTLHDASRGAYQIALEQSSQQVFEGMVHLIPL